MNSQTVIADSSVGDQARVAPVQVVPPPANLKVAVTPPLSPTTDLVYRFQIARRAHPPEFKNLWQLIAKSPTDNGPVELIDADTLETVINRIRYLFEADGL